MLGQDSIDALGWVQRNRTRRQRAAMAADVVAGLARALARDDGGRLGAVSEILNGVVDLEFREKCSLAALRGGTLHVEVTAPCWVSAMQRRWADGLLRVLRERAPRMGVRQVRFGFGNSVKPLADRVARG